jgi:putative spermidine/putrescine transport system substrate-binding protein
MLTIMLAFALLVGGSAAPASAQVPATTGPDVIEDLTGSGRAKSDREGLAREAGPDRTEGLDEAPRGEGATPADAGDKDAPPVNSGAGNEEATRAKQPELVVGSWAGAYGAAQRKAIIEPIEQQEGIRIERRTHDGNRAELAGADAVELGQEVLLRACEEGRLVPLSEWPDASSVASRESANADFLVDVGEGCGLPSFAWSSLVIANPKAMKKLAKRRYREPGKIGDLIDVTRYPGKRALLRQPRRVLEMMLLADGVARGEVYQVLASRQGEDRVFKLLDELKPSIEWVSGSREAFAALDEGRATMAMTFSGRAFRRLIASELRPIWDGHIMSFSAWAVPKASGRREAAVRFIRAAVEPEMMAAQARIWPYGPMRRSAAQRARRHALLGTELDVFLPTSELRFDQGIVFDGAFWSEHGARLDRRFEDWLAGVPLGIRVPPPRKAPPAPLPPPPRLSTAG